MPQDISGYDVGALLYCPANAHHTVSQAVAAERLPRPFSLALCLEDTVRADALAAEGLTPEEQEQLGILLEKVYRAAASDRREER